MQIPNAHGFAENKSFIDAQSMFSVEEFSSEKCLWKES